MDLSVGQAPDSMGGQLVLANKTCISIGTMSEFDGETEISLTDDRYTALEDDILVYEGALITPGNKLSICSVLNEALATIDVGENCRVRVFVNDSLEPNRIKIVVDH